LSKKYCKLATEIRRGRCLQKLLLNYLLKVGSSGKVVRVWQTFVGAEPDGFFGPQTERLTAEWQFQHGLNPSGKVDKHTWAAVGYELLRRELDEMKPTPAVPA